MIVYGSTLSPFVRKVMAYLAEKGLTAELVASGLGRGGPEFVVGDAISPADISVASPFVNLAHCAVGPLSRRHPGAAQLRGHGRGRTPDGRGTGVSG